MEIEWSRETKQVQKSNSCSITHLREVMGHVMDDWMDGWIDPLWHFGPHLIPNRIHHSS